MWRSQSAPLRLATIELREHVLGEAVLDLAMARSGPRDTRLKIAIPIVLGTVPNQNTASLFDALEERGSIHAT